jgi:glycosyltransferase involved in cell wall biosynthesis
MRVLVTTNMYPTAERPAFGIFVARQVASLERAGMAVAVETVSGHRGAADYWHARRRIARQVREFRPDLIHAHYGLTSIPSAGQGVPFVVTLYGDDINGQSTGRGRITFKSRLSVLATQLLNLAAARVLVQSEAMQSRLWPSARARSDVVPSGIDEDLFSPRPRGEARQHLGLPSEGWVLGFVNSGGQPTKRLDLAQATAAELERRGHKVTLLVAEKVSAAEMPWYYRASDCLLMTSDLEGSPNCVKEALACGTPIVSVPVGDVPQVVDSAERGRITDRNPAALADAVADLLGTGPVALDTVPPSLLPPRLRSGAVAMQLREIYAGVLAQRQRAVSPAGSLPGEAG